MCSIYPNTKFLAYIEIESENNRESRKLQHQPKVTRKKDYKENEKN